VSRKAVNPPEQPHQRGCPVGVIQSDPTEDLVDVGVQPLAVTSERDEWGAICPIPDPCQLDDAPEAQCGVEAVVAPPP